MYLLRYVRINTTARGIHASFTLSSILLFLHLRRLAPPNASLSFLLLLLLLSFSWRSPSLRPLVPPSGRVAASISRLPPRSASERDRLTANRQLAHDPARPYPPYPIIEEHPINADATGESARRASAAPPTAPPTAPQLPSISRWR